MSKSRFLKGKSKYTCRSDVITIDRIVLIFPLSFKGQKYVVRHGADLNVHDDNDNNTVYCKCATYVSHIT